LGVTNANEAALVLFSGGQDSTVCLAWALTRFSRVETVGFDYRQRHKVELTLRPRIRERIAALGANWKARLGDDHVISLDALAAISDSALTRDMAIEIADGGLPTTFVPGRNLIFFCFSGALAYRRGARHLVGGMCETDYSGYPDCRDDTVKAMQVALALGLDKRLTILRRRCGSTRPTLSHWPKNWVGAHCSMSLSRKPIAVIWATARTGTIGALAAANVRPASCARKVLPSSGTGERRHECYD
jgi:queuosine biosynthesis protein QueC